MVALKRLLRPALGVGALALGVGFLSPAAADACSCGSSPYICNGMQDLADGTAVIFAGTVVAIADVHGDIGSPREKQSVVVQRRVRLRIDEALTGVTGKDIEVTTNGMSAACGYDFQEGQRYLVYTDSRSLDVSLCSRTKLLAKASDEIALLRDYRRGRVPRRIFGSVYIAQPGDGPTDLQGLRIVATGAGQRYETVTDALGQFRFRDLPLGEYTVRAWVNDTFSKEARFDPILSTEQSCAEVNFLFRPGARFAGTIVDSAGRPVRAATVVIKDITPFEFRPVQGPDSFSGYSNDRGKFEIDGVIPGAYVPALLLRQQTKDQPTSPYVTLMAHFSSPTASWSNTLIGLSRDQNLEDVRLELPDLALADLKVSIVRPDGGPAERVRVELQDARSGWTLERFAPSDGNIALRLFVGQAYRIRAYNIQGSRDEGKASRSVEVSIRPQNEPVTIRLEPLPSRPPLD